MTEPANEAPASSSDGDDGPVVAIALQIGDRALRQRMRQALSAVAMISLVDDADDADLVLADDAAAPANPFDPHALDDDDDDAAPAPRSLTDRERQVVQLMSTGASNKAIGRALGISVHTAKFHVTSIMLKLDATSRTDAVARAMRAGLVLI